MSRIQEYFSWSGSAVDHLNQVFQVPVKDIKPFASQKEKLSYFTSQMQYQSMNQNHSKLLY